MKYQLDDDGNVNVIPGRGSTIKRVVFHDNYVTVTARDGSQGDVERNHCRLYNLATMYFYPMNELLEIERVKYNGPDGI